MPLLTQVAALSFRIFFGESKKRKINPNIYRIDSAPGFAIAAGFILLLHRCKNPLADY
jgi:hypothetical protein